MIVSAPACGPTNMSVDAALLDRAVADDRPTLRFYRWQPATLSLGYFQSLTGRETHSASSAVPLVRRASGGGAIVHDRELTYSLVVPTGHRLPAETANDRQGGSDSRSGTTAGGAPALYHAVHEAMIASLGELGVAVCRFAATGESVVADDPFLCFQRRTGDDLVLNRYKIFGSAQRRGRSAVLQHGSLLLEASPAAPELPGIANLIGTLIEPEQVIERFSAKLATMLGVVWEAAELTPSESALADEIRQRKFAAAAWTEKR